MLFLIDVVGTCNLRCPSCPVGNMSDGFISDDRPKGFMKLDYFKAVVEKGRRECQALGVDFKVALYNWGESLIHPEIGEIVAYLHKEKVDFDISSNFNVDVDLWEIVKAAPTMLRISLSGGTNDTYQKNHVKGDINLVISNLYRLRHLMDKAKKSNGEHKMYVQVYYHLYKDNCGDDLLKIHNLCSELNFHFVPGIAYFMPLEKMMYGLANDEKFSAADKAILDRMYISLEEARIIASAVKSPSCALLDTQVVINHDGSVPVCCAVYDPVFRVDENYLDISLPALQAKRGKSQICGICMEHGLHDVALQNPVHVWNQVVRGKQLSMGTKYMTNVISQPSIEFNPNYRSLE